MQEQPSNGNPRRPAFGDQPVIGDAARHSQPPPVQFIRRQSHRSWMIVFSVGLPSQLTIWCDRLITKLIGLAVTGAEAIEAESLEAVAAGAIRTGAAHLVVCTRRPGNRLQSEIVQAGHPFVITSGDPRAAFAGLLASGMDVAVAARLVASGCAGMRRLTTAPNALVLLENGVVDAVQTATAIAAHLGVRADTRKIVAIIRELTEAGVHPDASGGEPAPPDDERTTAVINGAVLPYIAHLASGAELEPLVWERELFYLNEDPPADVPVQATRPVDLTGRPRILIHGPGIALPPGNWRANVVLAFSGETIGMSFLVDICSGAQLSQTRIESTGERVIVAELRFTVDAMSDELLELHAQSERAAFDGQIGLGHVTLTRESETGAPPQE